MTLRLTIARIGITIALCAPASWSATPRSSAVADAGVSVPGTFGWMSAALISIAILRASRRKTQLLPIPRD